MWCLSHYIRPYIIIIISSSSSKWSCNSPIVFFQSEFSRRLRSGVASCMFRYCFASLRPSCSCLILSSILVRSIFPPITCFRKESLHKMCPIQLTFLHFVAHSMYLTPQPNEKFLLRQKYMLRCTAIFRYYYYHCILITKLVAPVRWVLGFSHLFFVSCVYFVDNWCSV